MRVEDLIVLGKREVHSDFARMLLADLLDMNPLDLYNNLDKEVDIDIKEKYLKRIALLKEDKPIQYVIGNVNFYGLKYMVNENVLIPRFETEELVENTLKFIKEKFPSKNDLKIIDLGCGSGAIGLTLKHFLPSSSVHLLDISEKALEVARFNGNVLELDVTYHRGNMLNDIYDKFDVIISNPPYIKTDEEIEELVKNNEPSLALYGGEDGLKFYRQILSTIGKNLNSNFIIAFEIGYDQGKDIEKIAYDNLENIEVVCKKDLSGRDRMIFIFNK